ncbi:MAG: tRNA (guanosine(46)-N7)-methyltransferase TrmB [Bacteroidales bacterium]|nr:tRNA (guanosine(46)-N7)-methyltransferase TrmB [Bacteroidales bacterium]
MGHGKLRKFAENETFHCLLQPSAEEVLADGYFNLADHPVKGRWIEQMFGGHEGPIVLELGCGKGEYTLELARRNPDKNYIGVDIKGARLWRGAKTATEEGLCNVAFLRTRIEFITAFFGPDEVSEIWLTFSDPQLRASENKRLSSAMFLERYRHFLRPGGIIHLKTDSRFLFEYTRSVATVNGLPILVETTDLYSDGQGHGTAPSGVRFAHPTIPSERSPRFRAAGGTSLRGSTIPLPAEVREVQTFYETMFLEMGLPITYMEFCPDHDGPYLNPRDPEDFDSAYWRTAEGPRRSLNHQ